MTDNELRRLSRAELLEILIRLTNENEELKRNLNDAEGKLNDRKIMICESGSIAEAALKLSDVFAAAESAAKLYLENSERLCGEKIQPRVAHRPRLTRKLTGICQRIAFCHSRNRPPASQAIFTHCQPRPASTPP